MAPLICPSCERETHPFDDSDIEGFGVVTKCANEGCYARIPKSLLNARAAEALAARVAAAPASHTRAPAAPAPALALAPQLQPIAPLADQIAAALAPAPIAVEQPRAPGGLRADDLLDFARARLAVVLAQLDEKTALEAEAAKLRRILASDEPLPVKALN